MIFIVALVVGCAPETKVERVEVIVHDTIFIDTCTAHEDLADVRDNAHPYPIHDSRGNIDYYGNFKAYMFSEGFPDTIIVPFTRNGKFEMYVEATRWETREDSLGNPLSPIYRFGDVVGHAWYYDLKGHFIEFAESPYPHSTKDEEEPYKP